MKRDDISAALSDIKTEYIEEAENDTIRAVYCWKGKLALLAACLTCVVGLSLYLPGPAKNESAAPGAEGESSAPISCTEKTTSIWRTTSVRVFSSLTGAGVTPLGLFCLRRGPGPGRPLQWA